MMNSLRNIKKSIKQLILPGRKGADKQILNDALAAFERVLEKKSSKVKPNILRMVMRNPITKIAVVASFLVIASFTISFVLYGKVVDLRTKLKLAQNDIAATPIEDSVTINFYFKEHQDTIAQYASLNSVALQPLQMQINQDDLMYYELFGNQHEFLNPGMIIRGPSYQQEIESSESPTISNGYTMTISEAREIVDFDLVSPQMLHPGFRLNKIRKIDDRDALHFLYTDNIKTVSLFEQHLEGERGLVAQDFREYAVYQNEGKTGGAILTWRDNTLSYVLIGNIEMSQLMDIAKSISAIK